MTNIPTFTVKLTEKLAEKAGAQRWLKKSAEALGGKLEKSTQAVVAENSPKVTELVFINLSEAVTNNRLDITISTWDDLVKLASEPEIIAKTTPKNEAKLIRKNRALTVKNNILAASKEGLEKPILLPSKARIYDLKEAVDFKWMKPFRSTWRLMKWGYQQALRVIFGDKNMTLLAEKFQETMPASCKDKLSDFLTKYKTSKGAISLEERIAFAKFKASVSGFLTKAFKGDAPEKAVDNWITAFEKQAKLRSKIEKETKSAAGTTKAKVVEYWHQFTDWMRGLANKPKKYAQQATSTVSVAS